MFRIVYLIILSFLFPTSIVAQGKNPYLFRNWALENAAPIFSVEQTKDGLLWLGTQKGLYSYDGYRFVSHISANSPTMIYCQLVVGTQLYLGCENGVVLYDMENERYLPLKWKQLVGVRSMLRQGNIIYVGTAKGLYAYDLQLRNLKLLSKECKQIFSLAATPAGILIGTRYGLFEYQLGKCKSLKYLSVLRDKPISAVKYDAAHQQYWVGTFEGLFSLKLYANDAHVKQLTGSLVIKSLEVIQNKLFLCSDDGLYVCQDGKLVHYLHNSLNPFSLGNDVVWDVFCNHNQIFLGTDEGLTVCNLSPKFNFHPLNALTSGMTIGNNLTQILRDKNGQMWLGGSGGSIRLGKEIVWYRQHDGEKVISHNHVRKIYEDKDGLIWISTDNGLNLYNPHTKSIRKKMIYDEKAGHNVPWIYDMVEDDKGRLWLGTCDKGIYIVNKEKLIRAKYLCLADIHLSEKLLDNSATQLLLDNKGCIWVRMKNGFQMINTNNFSIKTVARASVSQILIDHDGYFWGVNELGLTCYTPNGEKRESIVFDSAMELSSIVALLEIDGDVWVFTPSFCSIYGKKGWSKTFKLPFLQAKCVYYDKSTEQVIVGGRDAFLSFSPKKVKSEEENLRLQLSAVKVNGLPYRCDDQQLRSLSQMILEANENNFSLALTDLPLLNENFSVYAYTLDGLEKSWHYLQTAKDEISYNGIPYGDYTLQVCMVNGFGKIGKQLYSIKIKVLPPWYLSTFAKSVYLLIFILLVYWLIKLYIIRVKLKMEHLEKIRIKDDLDMRIQFYNNLAKQLYQRVSNLMCQMVLLSKNDAQKDNLNMNKLRFEATKLNATIRESLDLNDLLTNEEYEEKILPLDLVSSFQVSLNGFQKEARQKDIKLMLETDDSTFLWRDSPIKWDKFSYILLKSMVDYSQQGAIVKFQFSQNLELHQMTITVSCDKFLVNEENLPNFFYRYANIKIDDAEERTLDMYFIKEYIENKSGSIQIQKDATNRVCFLLSLPIINKEQPVRGETSTHKEVVLLDYQDEKFLKMVTKVIEENMGNSDFNVTRLQNILGFGRKLLYRKIKMMTGMSPVEYIRYIRLKQAAALLSQGRFAISEVMYVVGFSNSGYFSKCFQNEYGMTPTAYVRNRTEQNN